jgi:hypothetical protein
MPPCSNGNSFNDKSLPEPWVVRLLRPVQDRGPV